MAKLPTNVSVSPVTGVYRWRKVVPATLRGAVGKSELKKSLRTKNLRLATILAMKEEAEAELLLNKARVSLGLDLANGSASATPFSAYQGAVDYLASLGLGPIDLPRDDPRWRDRREVIDYIYDQHRNISPDGEEAYPTLSDTEAMRIDALSGSLKKPVPTWSEACAIYLADTNGSQANRSERGKRAHEQSVARHKADMIAAIGGDLTLAQIGRPQIRKLREYLVDKDHGLKKGKKISAGTVNRSLQISRAIYAHCNKEHGLGLNPEIFDGLKIDDGIADKDRRFPMPDDMFSDYLTVLDMSEIGQTIS